MKDTYTIALLGNPNCGKTTIFNALTGARQHVGNYPGVTVERKEGSFKCDGHSFRVVDLPGIYSLSAQSDDERIARDFIINENPDIVIDVVDFSNLERNLYLTTQLIELGIPMILAFNMSDVVKKNGIEYDLVKMEQMLGCPIICTVGNTGEGIANLIQTIAANIDGERTISGVSIKYSREIEKKLVGIVQALERSGELFSAEKLRWTAIKLMEDDPEIVAQITDSSVRREVENSIIEIEKITNETPDISIVDGRYGFVSGVVKQTIKSMPKLRRSTSDKIDSVLTNRLLGIPIFFGLMYLVFHITFTLGGPPMDWIDAFFGWAGDGISGWWPEGSESPLKSLLVDGIIGGMGGVIIFLPNILLLFLAIAFLEDSGYLPRAAFIMDRLMYKLGLPGKSFMPMLIGFGCSIPAIMATRTLENKKDRLITILITPLMSCGARLPIYALIIPAFFPVKLHGIMLWTIYVIGIFLAIISAKLLRMTMFKGPSAPLIMELPPYRIPTIKAVMIHMWERGWLYVKKAGTVILGISIVLWALTSYPKLPIDQMISTDPEAIQAEELSYSIAGRIGHALEPAIKPMGFDWRIGTALIGAFAAKEVFVAQMGIVYSVGEADEESEALREKLQSNYSPLVGFCIMLFALISAPCMATIAVTKRESNSWKWALFQLGGLTTVAYILTVVVYQIGLFLKIGI